MKFATREEWLNYVAQRMAPMFDLAGAPLPDAIRVAIGFTSAGRRGKRIGECWDNCCSEDRHFEVFIRPDLAESPDLMPMAIAAILAHELVHTAVGIPEGHRKGFRRVAQGIGLAGPMRSTVAGPDFEAALLPILQDAGPLPHARLDTHAGETTGPKKQTSRMVKCQCVTCGYTARTARKWLEEVGPPHCPTHGQMAADDPGADSEDDS